MGFLYHKRQEQRAHFHRSRRARYSIAVHSHVRLEPKEEFVSLQFTNTPRARRGHKTRASDTTRIFFADRYYPSPPCRIPKELPVESSGKKFEAATNPVALKAINLKNCDPRPNISAPTVDKAAVLKVEVSQRFYAGTTATCDNRRASALMEMMELNTRPFSPHSRRTRKTRTRRRHQVLQASSLEGPLVRNTPKAHSPIVLHESDRFFAGCGSGHSSATFGRRSFFSKVLTSN